MDVLVGRVFGIGNAVMCVPMLKALSSFVENVDVLVGSFPDDEGSFHVMNELKRSKIVRHVMVDSASSMTKYDVAVMSMPYDGRWIEGKHFFADRVVDGRTRPDPSTVGLSSWKKHEVLYQMDTVYDMGYAGTVPDTSFIQDSVVKRDNLLYLGVGYKKDASCFWSKKHWGNDNFSEFVASFLEEFPQWSVVSTGNVLDWQMTLRHIRPHDRCKLSISLNVGQAFDVVKRCSLYVGNDTGMMHVADSFGIPCVVPFFLENSITKAKPFNVKDSICIDAFDRTVSVEEMMICVRSLCQR